MTGLTDKQLRFAKLYNGNGIQTAKIAGYSGNDNVLNQSAIKNLKNPLIKDIIDKRKNTKSGDIATKEDRQEFWTEVMYDDALKMNIRLDASKLLGKSQGDFIDRKEIKTELNQRAVIKIPDLSKEQWEEMFETNLEDIDNGK